MVSRRPIRPDGASVSTSPGLGTLFVLGTCPLAVFVVLSHPALVAAALAGAGATVAGVVLLGTTIRDLQDPELDIGLPLSELRMHVEVARGDPAPG